MRVRELMTGALITARPDMPVLDARHLMIEKRIRHLLVTNDPYRGVRVEKGKLILPDGPGLGLKRA